ncbi:helix-turn-helix domain-containing protein [Rhizobium leguminosarum]|uniref:helix-turn-helix domain-containing protein n=2 Tax=Rhizobium leguminosarum TaxID=384 RepID=UPI00140FE6C4|nr:helix-turn-helix domain-containing protein [Rhizobium leguminosarum]MBY2912408.1 helix-turn-helix domain-containing protein [Rhizobium leguminosarum]MBY5430279.1 helix-turn-helix domain-containing protein [Rhizobium leguminosarum]QIO53896.1 helix-turn-helix domain-containing protein [Rhizobium leguminosarum bv. trifolii]
MLTAEQVRAARALLRMEQKELAERAGVSLPSIKRLEQMEGALTATRVSTIEAIRAALEKAGVRFIPENGGGAGVRLAKPAG